MLEALRAALEKTAELAQLVEGFELEPSEVELREISRELHEEKGRAQVIPQLLLRSENPLTVVKAFGMVQKDEETAA
jgi:hypothetical protein